VINSRPSDEGKAIRRRRECTACRRRFTTYERAQLEALLVVKRDGRREAFDPNKLLRGLTLACEKRPVSEETLRRFAFGLEDELRSAEVSSDEVGRRAMIFLRGLDEVAYIRFASVYRQFDDAQAFVEEVRTLSKKGEL
jgi:transcriptional repressor NrdR